jgi:hypothetical protein
VGPARQLLAWRAECISRAGKVVPIYPGQERNTFMLGVRVLWNGGKFELGRDVEG